MIFTNKVVSSLVEAVAMFLLGFLLVVVIGAAAYNRGWEDGKYVAEFECMNKARSTR